MKALVLSGGGSKGSYQIGVWKALRKLHIKFDIVTGTSVGALNGALFTQKSYKKAIKVWKKLNLKVLFGEYATDSTDDKTVLKMYRNNFFKYGGMEVKELEKLIEDSINAKNFYSSNINFGLVTFNLSGKKPVQITKKDIPHHLLGDYLMASASCYPAFQQKDIEGKKFIDGGVFDNLPINLAIDLGADEIIAIDLLAPGFKQIPKKKLPTTIIKPNNKLTNFLNFNEEGAKRNIKLGYNDTLKKFGKLEGKKYSFKKNNLQKNKQKHLDTYQYTFYQIINNDKLITKFKQLLKIVPTNEEKLLDSIMLKVMEDLGKSFALEETLIYSYKKFNKLLIKKTKLPAVTKETKQILDMLTQIREKKYKEIRKKAILSPLEFLKALYLYTICEV